MHTYVYAHIDTHLPHTITTQAKLKYAEAIENCLELNRKRTHQQHLIIGIDGNAVVGAQQESDDTCVVGEHGIGARTKRGEEFVRFASELGACITNTFAESQDKYTCDFSLLAVPKEIDYVLVDHALQAKSTGSYVGDSSATVSDHRPLVNTFVIKSNRASHTKASVKIRKPVGWRCNSHTFIHDVQGALSDTSTNVSITSFAAAVASAASRHGKARRRSRRRLSEDHALLLQLRKLESDRRTEPNPLLRQQLSKLVCKVRRQVKRIEATFQCEQAANSLDGKFRLQKRKVPSLLSDVAGNAITDTADREPLITTFYEDLFDGSSDVLPDWIHHSFSLEDTTVIDMKCLQFAIHCLACGKACSDDGVVAEMLKELEEEQLIILLDLYNARLLNLPTAQGDTCWDELLVQLVQKRVGAKLLAQFRPIAIISVLSKVYSKCLLLLSVPKLGAELLSAQFAFRKGFQAGEVIFILRQMIEKCLEWDLKLFVFDGDIHKAYDHTMHSRVLEALIARGVPRPIAAAWIREIRRQSSVFVLNSSTRSRPIQRTRSLVQGDPSAPTLFNTTLDDCLRVFVTTAFLMEWGVKLHNVSIHHLFFADNAWLLATSLPMLASMISALLEALTLFGWSMPLSEACWCTTVPDTWPRELVVNEVCVKRQPRATGIKALGVQVTFDGRCGYEMEKRVDRAWSAFYSKKHLLLCPSAAISARIKLLEKLVPATLFWCAGSWCPTRNDLKKLWSVQLAMIEKIVRLRPRPLEDIVAFMPRCARTCTNFMESVNVARWDFRAHLLISRFAGHVARIEKYDQGRLTVETMHWRNQKWLDIVAASNGGRQLHCRKLSVEMGAHFGQIFRQRLGSTGSRQGYLADEASRLRQVANHCSRKMNSQESLVISDLVSRFQQVGVVVEW